MLNLLIGLNVLIFVLISLLHFYWVFGGTWGLSGAMPERYKVDFFNPNLKWLMKFATLAVAFGLLLFAYIIYSNTPGFTSLLPASWVRYGTMAIAAIFLLRAIGDFNFVGLFKKSDGSEFAEKDSRFYVPLCLVIGVVSLLIIYLK